MKKIISYFISSMSIVCMLIGLFGKKDNLMNIGFYMHIVYMTWMSIEEYNNSKKIKFNIIFYIPMLAILTLAYGYQLINK